jgi:hypothetical protein
MIYKLNTVDGFSVINRLPSNSKGNLMNEKEKPNLHFIGLGGGGTNILEYFHKKDIQAKYTSITNCSRPHFPSDIQFIQFLPPTKNCEPGDGTIWMESDMSQPLKLTKNLKGLFDADDQYILFAGLGGYTGTKMVDTLIPWLQKEGKDFLVICNLPLAFEGANRNSMASNLVKKYRYLPNFKYFDLEAVMEVHGNNTIPVAHEHCYSIFLEANKNLNLPERQNFFKKRFG